MKRFLIISGIVLTIGVVGFLILQPEPPFGRETNDTTLTNLQTKYDQAPEIKARYQLDKGALVKTNIKNAELTRNGEVKDKVEVVIGNRIDPELMGAKDVGFEPTIELTRWDEVSFKIIPDISDVDLKDRTLTFDKEKILFETPKMDFEMYEYTESEGGMKYIWYLKEKPLTNKIEFKIESEGLDFFYQAPLTEIETAPEGGSISETEIKDKDGNLLMYRPENVVGSYAVYHKTKGGINDINGMEYRAGKAFHIYRPKIIDSDGKETWGILNIDTEQGLYTVEIPQEFLDKAVYPIKSNDDFGDLTRGGSTRNIENKMYCGYYVSGASSGTGDSISWAQTSWNSGDFVKLHLYDSSKNKVTDGQASQKTGPEASGEYIAHDLAASPTINASSGYYMCVVSDETIYQYVDTSGGTSHNVSHIYPNAFPASLTGSDDDDMQSIYTTYTADAPPPAADEDPPIIIITD